MQSADYVPGVSGWKIDDHVRLVLNDGNRRIHAEVKLITTAGPGQTNDEAAQAIRDLVHEVKDQLDSRVTSCEGKVSELGAPITAQGQAISTLASRVTGMNNSTVSMDQSGYLTGEKPARQAMEEVVSRSNADLELALRIGSFECRLPAGTVSCRLLADEESASELEAYAERFGADDSLASTIRQVIRDELKPGGMLHRG